MTIQQFFHPLVGHHFGSQNTQQIAAHTSTLLRGLTMVHTCVVAGCRNRRTPGTTLSFYRFPRDPERKQRWIAAVNREGWVPNDGSRLCSTHFISGMNAVQRWGKKYPPPVRGSIPLFLRMLIKLILLEVVTEYIYTLIDSKCIAFSFDVIGLSFVKTLILRLDKRLTCSVSCVITPRDIGAWLRISRLHKVLVKKKNLIYYWN